MADSIRTLPGYAALHSEVEIFEMHLLVVVTETFAGSEIFRQHVRCAK